MAEYKISTIKTADFEAEMRKIKSKLEMSNFSAWQKTAFKRMLDDMSEALVKYKKSLDVPDFFGGK